MTSMSDLQTPNTPTWCPGCGNFPLWMAFKNACIANGWDNSNTTLVAGIGCHGHLVNFTRLTSIEGLHGRPLPLANGIKLANQNLNVFVFTGDGDCLGEGGNHFIHSARRNHHYTVILHDNGLYALTTGQASPVTDHDVKTRSTPEGNPDFPLNPVTMAIASGATFVARVYASDMKLLQNLITQANSHKGFALIDVLQPCETFNKILTHKYYQDNTYYLPENYDPTNKVKAFEISQQFGEKSIACGVIYKEEKETHEEQYQFLKENSLINIDVSKRDINKLFSKYL